MSEVWKAVPGFEGFYEVSDTGRVRSLPRVVVCSDGKEKFYRGRVLRPGPRPSGHLTVSLCGDSHNVHTLVLTAFVGPRPTPTTIARHLDGNEQNNRVGNLEWSNRVRNGQDKKWHRPPANYKLTPTSAAELKFLIKTKVFSEYRLAKLYGVSATTVSNIRKGVVHADV